MNRTRHRRDPGAEALLPGVVYEPVRIAVRCSNVEAEIRRARRRAAWRDVADASLLLAVDLLFARWQNARLPFADRDQSLDILLVVNLLVIAHLLLARVIPLWRARRISRTWCPLERRRLRITSR